MDDARRLSPEAASVDLAPSPDHAPGSFGQRQWRVLAVLALINLVNYVDRQIIFPLFPYIRREFGLTHLQSGSLATAFTVVLSVCSLPLGMVADRTSRRMVVSAGVLFWSAATFLSGLAASFRALLVARSLVGVGEAAYTPAGAAMITANFPRSMRARVQGVFDIGMFAGGAIGVALGGIMAQYFGWRAAFFLVGVPGVLLAISALRLPEAPRQAAEQQFPLRSLLRVPAYVTMLLAGWFSSFAGYAYIVWGPELVEEYKGFTAGEAGVVLGITVIVCGGCGVAVGATLADWLARRAPWGRAGMIPVGFLIAAPLIYGALHASQRSHFIVLFGLGAFFLSWYHGPVTATIHDLIPAQGHATALGLYYLFVNLFSMALAPLVIGDLADHSNLISALHAAIAAQLIGGALFVVVVLLMRRQSSRNQEDREYAATGAVS
ncbi:MAG TPA: MFS transporter [Terriglobales bacterium]|nr:MFS transporter [Terriglobales bacterium]